MGLVDGKAALVTGGASGIGRATVEILVREGARVVLADLNEVEGEKRVEAIRSSGGDARFVRTDVTREADVERLVAAVLDYYGRLDCAVNSAGITGGIGPVQELSQEDWEHTLAINLTGVFLCTKHEVATMQGQGSGAIVNVASGSGVIATPGLSAYCASKHAVLGLTKTVALENARTGVRVNAICPGTTDTPMLRAAMASDPNLEKLILRGTPGGRFGRPEEIAEGAVWLCSDRASFVTGESLLVDGGAVAR